MKNIKSKEFDAFRCLDSKACSPRATGLLRDEISRSD